MMRPSLSLYFLMYTQIFFVTSVRGIDFPPQIAANAGLRVFGAKSPTPFFFMAAATFFPEALLAVLPRAFLRDRGLLRRSRRNRCLRRGRHSDRADATASK